MLKPRRVDSRQLKLSAISSPKPSRAQAVEFLRRHAATFVAVGLHSELIGALALSPRAHAIRLNISRTAAHSLMLRFARPTILCIASTSSPATTPMTGG
jgi:hypothetical protein